MRKLAIVLCLLASPALAEPPDWYAHLSQEQRTALMATRHAGPPAALIGGGSVYGWRGQPLAPYSAPKSPARFDASALVHPPRYGSLYRLLWQDRERRILWTQRQPDARNSLTWRMDRQWRVTQN